MSLLLSGYNEDYIAKSVPPINTLKNIEKMTMSMKGKVSADKKVSGRTLFYLNLLPLQQVIQATTNCRDLSIDALFWSCLGAIRIDFCGGHKRCLSKSTT